MEGKKMKQKTKITQAKKSIKPKVGSLKGLIQLINPQQDQQEKEIKHSDQYQIIVKGT